jgi:hypothetical protein
LFTELMVDAAEAGRLRPGIDPRRAAAMTMRTVMCIAESNTSDDETIDTVTSDEVWGFCATGFGPG